MTFRPFRSGEYVDLGGVAGTVQNVQIFSTTLRTVDGKIVVVPNGKIIAGNIINFSREPLRRNEFIIGVAYDADIDLVKQILTDIVMADARILQEALLAVDPDNTRQVKANTTYYLLKRTEVPILIVECGFLSNPIEAELLLQDDYQDQLVNAIYTGIKTYLGDELPQNESS